MDKDKDVVVVEVMCVSCFGKSFWDKVIMKKEYDLITDSRIFIAIIDITESINERFLG